MQICRLKKECYKVHQIFFFSINDIMYMFISLDDFETMTLLNHYHYNSKTLSKANKSKKLQDLVNFNKKFVINLANENFSDAEFAVLGKGLKFIAIPKDPQANQLDRDTKQFMRKMRIRYIMSKKRAKQTHKFKKASNWTPLSTPCLDLENYLESTRLELSKIKTRNIHDNLTKNERQAIKSLKEKKHLVFQKPDKSRGIVVINKTDYIHEGETMLQGNQYTSIDADMTSETVKLVQKQLNLMLWDQSIDKNTHTYLYPEELKTRTPVCYFLPKTHKPTPAGRVFTGRPIISNCGGPCEKIGEFIDFFLVPLVKKQTTYLRDTKDVIRKIEQLKLPQNCLLVTIDCIGMFTNVLQNEVEQEVIKVLRDTNPNIYFPRMPPVRHMEALLKLVLHRNCFSFNEKYYLQTTGVPMGQICSPELCDIMFHSLEKKFISLSDKITKWLRYRDDILLFWDGDEHELSNFLNRVNTMHPTLKFTHEWSKHEINFLDLTLYKGERFTESYVLDIRCYTKPVDTFQYLSRDSSHPNSCFRGMIKGEAIRYIRNSSSEKEYKHKLDFFIQKLTLRGYEKSYVLDCLLDISYNQRNTYLEDVEKTKDIPLVFSTDYFPQRSNSDVKQALLKNWHHISNNQNLSRIFPSPPILALRRTQNLGEHLIRAKITKPEAPSDEDNSSENDTHMSQTLIDLIDLLEENYN